MIKAIIFDCFGVLTTDGWLPFKRKHFGHDPSLLQRATDLNKSVDAGLSSYDDFVKNVAELAGVPIEDAYGAIENNVADEELFRFIEQKLKPLYKIGMLSNAGADWLDELFQPSQVALFDAVALSYQTGIIKPDPRAYQIITERLGVDPEECIFVDDQERYCTAAAEQGMTVVCYQSFKQFQTDVELALKSR